MNEQLELKKERRAENDEITIDLVELWYLFLRKLKWIVVAAVIGGLALGLFSYYVEGPTYQSTAKMYIVSASNDSLVNLSELQISTNLTSDYKALLESRPLLEKVISKLKLDYTTKQLNDMITVANPSGTRIITISASAPDPVLSKNIANEMMYASVPWLAEIMSSNQPNVYEDAIDGVKTSSVAKRALIGAVVAAVLYFAVEVLRYLMNDTIRTSEEFERYFGIVPLASIPDDPSMNDGESDHTSSRTKALRKFAAGKAKHAKGARK